MNLKRILGNSHVSILFKVDELSGDLRTRAVIDRETLCVKTESTCTIDAEIIFLNGKNFEKIFKAEISVIDLNDNSPIFPSNTIELELSEDAKIGTPLRLDSATDADTDQYDIEFYRLKEKSTTKFFELKEQKLPNGKLVPQLELIRSLDFEKRPVHHLRLEAVDFGGLRGSAEINVHVLDVNDHNPKFDHENYEISISESTKIGEVIFTLKASDADSGKFGELEYSYDNTLVSNATRTLFILDKTSGRISVGAKLNYEASKQHTLYVEARDFGPSSIPAYTTVTINIINVNDNRPSIEVSFLTEPTIEPTISEDAQIGDFVAFVSVTDQDKGKAGELTAHLVETPGFELTPIDLDQNRYIIRTKSQLDRERVSRYDLVIEAADSGIPPLVSQERISLKITGENSS